MDICIILGSINKKIYKKVYNQRLDFLHKVSTNLSNKYSALYMEDLKLQKMQQSGFSNVNKMMSDKSFGNFKLLLSYKLKERGKHLGLVNPAYTSQTCSFCGIIAASNRKSENYSCSCGHTQDADVNGARNILRKGLDWIGSLESPNKKAEGHK